MLSISDQQAAVYGLINRTIGAYHDINDFVIVISDGLQSPKGYNQDNVVVSWISILELIYIDYLNDYCI